VVALQFDLALAIEATGALFFDNCVPFIQCVGADCATLASRTPSLRCRNLVTIRSLPCEINGRLAFSVCLTPGARLWGKLVFIRALVFTIARSHAFPIRVAVSPLIGEHRGAVVHEIAPRASVATINALVKADDNKVPHFAETHE